jgi:hypothetical protein
MENSKPYVLTPQPKRLGAYKVNVDNIKSIKDIKLILKHLNIHFNPNSPEELEELKHLLIIN